MAQASVIDSRLRIGFGGARSRGLAQTPEWHAGLSFYPSGVRHPRHEHSRAQLSFLLCGGFADNAGGREQEGWSGQSVYRPAGSSHACDFGRSGALVLSINFTGKAPLPDDGAAAWRHSSAISSALTRLLFAGVAEPDSLLHDLIGSVAPSGPLRSSALPQWLRRAVEQIVDDPTASISAAAVAAGVHRVHFARAFQRHLGVSPTHFRLQCKSALAMRHMVELGEPPAIAAIAAGFADQSHWTRASRALCGLAPGRLRQLLAA